MAEVTSAAEQAYRGLSRRFSALAEPGSRPSDCSVSLVETVAGHPVGMFICPSDEGAEPDANTRWDDDGDPATPSAFCWDFSSAANISYSWQAPIRQAEKYVNGVSDQEGGVVLAADLAPSVADPSWTPQAITSDASTEVLQANLSPIHRNIRLLNILRADLGVVQVNRPDVGVDRDHIYTASGLKHAGSRSATSLDLGQHLSREDSFLIGPAGRD